MEPIRQEGYKSCGVAACGFILNKSHSDLVDELTLMPHPIHIHQKIEYSPLIHGVYPEQIVELLKKYNIEYTEFPYNNQNIKINGTIILFHDPKIYTSGHYLVYYNNKWANSWINIVECGLDVEKSKAGYNKDLNDIIDINILWVIQPKNTW